MPSIEKGGRERTIVPMFEMIISETPNVNTQNTATSQKSLWVMSSKTLPVVETDRGLLVRSGNSDVVSSAESLSLSPTRGSTF